MLWDTTSPSGGTKQNKEIRGGGTWGKQIRRLDQHEHREHGREMGHGLWSEKTRRVDRARRRSERNQRRTAARRSYVTPVAAGALVLSVILLIPSSTRAAGVLMLVPAGVALYVLSGRKKA